MQLYKEGKKFDIFLYHYKAQGNKIIIYIKKSKLFILVWGCLYWTMKAMEANIF